MPNQGRFRATLLVFMLAAAAFVVLALGSAPRTVAADDPPPASPDVVPGQLVVGFDDDVAPSKLRKTVIRAGGRIEERAASFETAVVEARGNRSADDVAAELARSDSVSYVEPNYILRAARVPNDVGLTKLWGLRNTGQLGGLTGADIHAPAAWDVGTGGEVVVAITDTGIDYRHPDLDGNLWSNPREIANGIDDDGNLWVDDLHGINLVDEDSDPDDDSGHGTHVAGIVGAEGNNVIGSVGVNWKVRLMALKFLDEEGEGSTWDAAEAIDYAVDAGAKVINASWGGPQASTRLFESIERAANRGVLVVAAAGNEGVDADAHPDYPAAFSLPNIISVTATDPDDRLLDFSNFGRTSVDLAAPGDEIYSTVPSDVSLSGYASYSGTSMAAPYVSGGAALYWSRSPASSAQHVRNALLQSVDVLPALAGKTQTGGRLNLAKALGVGAPAPSQPAQAGDTTAPSAFRLLKPRDRYRAARRGLRFRWQRSRDAGGIRYYRLYIDGKKRKTVRDSDGPGGRDPKPITRVRIANGRHRWFVRAYDYAGNHRTSKSPRRSRTSRSVLFVKSR